MVGVLVTALFTLRAGEREFDVALDTASISAALFTVAAGATGFLTLLSVFNPAIDAGPQFGAQLGRFLVELEVGRTWLITTVAGAALTRPDIRRAVLGRDASGRPGGGGLARADGHAGALRR